MQGWWLWSNCGLSRQVWSQLVEKQLLVFMPPLFASVRLLPVLIDTLMHLFLKYWSNYNYVSNLCNVCDYAVLYVNLYSFCIVCKNSQGAHSQVILPHLHKTHTHTHTHNHFTALWILSTTTRVSQYQKKRSPTHTYRGHLSSLICFIRLIGSMASCLFNLRAWQSFSTTYVQVFFGLPLALAPSTSYSIHSFTQSLSSFHRTCPYHRSLFCCSTEIVI